MRVEQLIDGENIIFGPPGTGKTSTLSGLVEQFAAFYGPDKILITSFTNAAARTIAGRQLPIPEHAINTLHGHAFRALGRPELVADHIKEWNDAHDSWAITGEGASDLDDVVVSGKTEGDNLYHRIQRYRAMMIPPERWVDVQAEAFYREWQAWKYENDLYDFTDLIEKALAQVYSCPMGARVLIADEAQDFTKLELSLIRQWGKTCTFLILAGDDDQCQPPDTPVLTRNRGYVRIDELDPDTDRLVSFDKGGGSHIRRKGYEFQVSKRPYRGPMILAKTASGREFKSTPDHRVTVKWSPSIIDGDKWAVYLMRKGHFWRVGITKLFRNKIKNFGIGIRGRQERADAAWLLRVCDTQKEAYAYEAECSVRYGITQMVFHSGKGTGLQFDQGEVDEIHEQLAVYGGAGALRIAAHLGLDLRYPIWEPDGKQRGQKAYFETRACNLIPGMSFLVDPKIGTKPLLDDITSVESYEASHDVYSLNVEPHHYYISGDGIVTCNCLYYFKGSEPEAFISSHLEDDRKHILSQSYRVPSVVQQIGQRWIERVSVRQEKPYRPRSVRGEYRSLNLTYNHAGQIVDEVEEYEAAGKTVMLITTCGYMLHPILKEMRSRGLPFGNKYAPRRGDWSPLAPRKGVSASERILSFLRPQAEYWGPDAAFWTGEELWNWVEPIRQKGVLKRGAKTLIGKIPGDAPVDIVDMGEWFEEDALEPIYTGNLDWFAENLIASKSGPYEYPMRVLQSRGIDGIRQRPLIIPGTIHSVKGGEADVVYVWPDLSRQGWESWHRSDEERDAIIRQGYVAMTRAYETLILGRATGPSKMW